MSGLYTGFLPRGANLEYVKKREGEAVRSCRAAAGGWVYLEIQGGARITQGGKCPPLNTPLFMSKVGFIISPTSIQLCST